MQEFEPLKEKSVNGRIQNGPKVIRALEFPETQSIGLTKTVYPIPLGLVILQWILAFWTLTHPPPDKESQCPYPAFCPHPLPYTHPLYLGPSPELLLAIPFSLPLKLRYSVKCWGRMLEKQMQRER